MIIGAGPAGNTCAIECAKKGLKVALIEKLDHPRVKVCGGGVVKRALDACPINIESVITQKVSAIDLVWHQSKMTITAKQAEPIIYMVERKKLDKLLFDEAMTLGIDYFPNTQLCSIKQSRDQVCLQSKTQEFTAKWVIGADGASGTTAKLAGWAKIKKAQSPAIDAHVILKEPLASKLNRTRFDFDVIKQGYGWVFPKGDHLSIGLGIFQSLSAHKNKVPLPELLNQYLDFLDIKKEDIISIEKKGFVIPTNYLQEGVTKGRVLLTGDAAGLADPLTAEGISAAIISGKLAASAILAPLLTLTVAETYQKKLEQELLIDLRVSEKLSRLLYTYTGLTQWVLRLQKKRAIRAVSKIFTGEKRFSHLTKNASLFRRGIFYFLTK